MGGGIGRSSDLQRVPAESQYRLGRSYVQASLRVVPNLGLTTASTEWNDPELPPNHWITYLVAPWTYAAYGGIGFSAVAEPYLNFGVAGIGLYSSRSASSSAVSTARSRRRRRGASWRSRRSS